MKSNPLIFVIFFLPSLHCIWTDLKEIYRTVDSEIGFDSIYTSHNTTLALLSEYSNNNVTLLALNSSFGRLWSRVFLDRRLIGTYNSQIKGNGIYFIITFSAYNYTSRRDEVLYSESYDNGKNWRELKVLPRADYSDEFARKDAKILYIKETGRVIIIYKIRGNNDIGYAAMVTKPPGSNIFLNERKIVQAESFFTFNAEYTYNSEMNQTNIHVIIRSRINSTDTFGYYVSTNNGVTWEFVQLLSTNYTNSMRTVAFGNYFVTIYPKLVGEWKLAINATNDLGKTWNGAVEPLKSDHYLNVAAAFTEENTLYLMIHYSSEMYGYLRMNMSSMKTEYFDNPFDGHIGYRSHCLEARSTTAGKMSLVAGAIFKETNSYQMAIAEDDLKGSKFMNKILRREEKE